jgi:hypothetical protein
MMTDRRFHPQPTIMVSPSLVLDALAEFYAAWGHRTLVRGGAVWFDGGAFSMMSLPTTLIPSVTDTEVRGILSRTGKLAAVYRVAGPSDVTVPVFMLRDKNYGAANLQRQFRQHVDRASSGMEARECTWEEWEAAALRCDRDTLTRHGSPPEALQRVLSVESRRQIAAVAQGIPGLRIHACFRGDEIAAYLVHLTFGGVCEGLLAKRVEALHDSVLRCASHLLYFAFAQSAMARPDVEVVCVGRGSVPAQDSLSQFKRHAGFQSESCHLRIRLHPVVAPFLENRAASGLMRFIRSGLSGKVPVLSSLEVLEGAGQKRNALIASIRQ